MEKLLKDAKFWQKKDKYKCYFENESTKIEFNIYGRLKIWWDYENIHDFTDIPDVVIPCVTTYHFLKVQNYFRSVITTYEVPEEITKEFNGGK